MGQSAIFDRRRNGRPRRMHAVRIGETKTVCGLPTGAGSGLLRDGDYAYCAPCPTCWPARRPVLESPYSDPNPIPPEYRGTRAVA